MIPINTAIGGLDICAWQTVRGITWVQTRKPIHARRLAQRSDGRQVMTGVHGGFLRTYEFEHSIAWAERLIERYTRVKTVGEVATSARRIGLAASSCTQEFRIDCLDTTLSLEPAIGPSHEEGVIA